MPKPSKRTTHQDIANAIGVSKTTVSLALKNHPRITEAMRKKVHQKAIDMGYTPDPMLSALAKYREQNQEAPSATPIAWLNLQPNPKTTHQQQEFIHYLKGATDAAKARGFVLEEFATAEFPPARLDTIFKTRNIRGLLLSPPDFSHPVDWKDFPWHDYAAVRLGRSEAFPKTHFITSAQATNGTIAYDAMQERGYKRIGLITDHRRRRVFGAGYLWATFPLPPEEQVPVLNFPWQMSRKEMLESLDKWIQETQPEAILSDIAAPLPDLLEDLGYKIPDDIAIATTTVRDTPINAGIDQRPEEIGHTAIRTLAALLNENTFGIPETRNEILIEGKWIDGPMLPPKKSSSEARTPSKQRASRQGVPPKDISNS